MKLRTCALMIATALAALPALTSEQDWELQTQEDRISIYTRPVSDSPYREVKATVTINAPVERVSALMGNGEGCVDWRAMCKSSKVVETVSDQERYVHMVLDLPWPLSDRDIVMHTLTEVDEATQSAVIHFTSDTSRPEEEKYVRAVSNGRFLIRTVAENEVEFTYIMHTDLGGELPVDTVNRRLGKSALDDLQRLQEMAEG